MKTFVDHGNGVKTVIAQQGADLITGTVQDCTPILEHAKALHNEGHHGSSEMRHAMTIPDVVIEKYCNERGITFHEFMSNKVHIRHMLNDPDLSMFRIWKGRV